MFRDLLRCLVRPIRLREDNSGLKTGSREIGLQSGFMFDLQLSEITIVLCGRSAQCNNATLQERRISANVYFC